MGKGPHHTGSFDRLGRILRAQANANPLTICWRCTRTLDQHPPHKDGRPAYWTAGHVRDGDPTSPILPEASVCNFAAGTRLRNEMHAKSTPSRRW